MLTGWMSAESSLWELLFSVWSHGLSWVTLQVEKARGMEEGGERVISWCLFFFFLSSNHPDFMITEILQISAVGEHHYNKYR